MVLVFLCLVMTQIAYLQHASANFYSEFDITWGNDNAKILDNGQQLQLTLEQSSGIDAYYISNIWLAVERFMASLTLCPLLLWIETGSGFQSKNEYLFAKIDMQIKLVPGNSAGTVTAYYVSLSFLKIM